MCKVRWVCKGRYTHPLPSSSKQSGLSPSENQVGEVRKQQLVSHLGTSLHLVRSSKGMHQTLHNCTEPPNINNLRGKTSVAHGFIVFSPGSLVLLVLSVW